MIVVMLIICQNQILQAFREREDMEVSRLIKELIFVWGYSVRGIMPSWVN